MSWVTVAPLLSLPHPKLHSSPSFLSSSSSSISSVRVSKTSSIHFSSASPFLSSEKHQICRAAGEYKFPDPIPDFADAETEKFRTHLLNKLSKKEMYEDSVEEIVGICTEVAYGNVSKPLLRRMDFRYFISSPGIFSTFLHTEYGGPGTLLVVPFIDMADTLNERGLPGGPQAARAAIKWAQNHVDKDWNEWTGSDES